MKMIDLIVKLVVGLALPWSVWVTVNVFSHSSFIDRTESNRFTSQDGLRITLMMQEMETRIMASTPNREWKDRIISLEECIHKLELGRQCS